MLLFAPFCFLLWPLGGNPQLGGLGQGGISVWAMPAANYVLRIRSTPRAGLQGSGPGGIKVPVGTRIYICRVTFAGPSCVIGRSFWG